MRDIKIDGAVGDGITDDTAAIQQCLDNNDSILFSAPSVGYKTTSPLIGHHGQHIEGEGVRGILSFGNGDCLTFPDGARNVSIERLYFEDRLATRTVGVALNLDGSSDAVEATIDGMRSYGFIDGLAVSGAMRSKISNCRWTSPKRHGLSFFYNGNASTGVLVDSCYSDSPGQYGYSIVGLSYSSLVSCACDDSGQDAYHFGQTNVVPIRSVSLISCGAEQPKGNGIWLEGQSINLVSPSISGVLAGRSCIYGAGAANVEIDCPFLMQGDYGINAVVAPKQVWTPSGNGWIVNLPYCDFNPNTRKSSQFISQFHDPFNYLTIVVGK